MIYNWQRHAFIANDGLFWAFYHDNTVAYGQVNVSTSTDGASWTYRFCFGQGCGAGADYSIWYSVEGNYFDYVYIKSNNAYYRRGTPNSDGSVTWWSSEQHLGNEYTFWATISIDSKVTHG